jgi:hypothetical protein
MSEKIQQVASHFLIIKNVCDRYVRPKIWKGTDDLSEKIPYNAISSPLFRSGHSL